jgi:hypothetical protein
VTIWKSGLNIKNGHLLKDVKKLRRIILYLILYLFDLNFFTKHIIFYEDW